MWKVLMVVVTGCLAVATASVVRQKSKDQLNQNEKPIYKDCGSKQGIIDNVSITPCGDTPPCNFPKGSNVTVRLQFTSRELITSATTKVHGIIEGVPVPFHLPDSDACHKMKCPVNKGSVASYTNSIAVLKAYPKVRLVVKWEITVENEDVVCFEVPAEITD